MKKFGIATLAATAALVGFAAPALAAPSATTNAQATISSLEEQGFHVVVNRLSERSLEEANVVSVGKGATFTHTVSGANNDAALQFGPVSATTVYVDVR
jgi:muramoyltetrapeptide carboxypeptidase LdcA involved in peptidoglycan recycling